MKLDSDYKPTTKINENVVFVVLNLKEFLLNLLIWDTKFH